MAPLVCMVVRGSSRVYFAKLADRIITGHGQEGYGPLNIDDLEIVLKAYSYNPVLFFTRICFCTLILRRRTVELAR